MKCSIIWISGIEKKVFIQENRFLSTKKGPSAERERRALITQVRYSQLFTLVANKNKPVNFKITPNGKKSKFLY